MHTQRFLPLNPLVGCFFVSIPKFSQRKRMNQLDIPQSNNLLCLADAWSSTHFHHRRDRPLASAVLLSSDGVCELRYWCRLGKFLLFERAPTWWETCRTKELLRRRRNPITSAGANVLRPLRDESTTSNCSIARFIFHSKCSSICSRSATFFD